MTGGDETTPASPSEPGAPASPGVPNSPPSEGASSFWLHLLSWFPFHLTVVLAWGQRNSWPDELLLCLLALPISALVIWDLYQSQRFSLAIEPERGQQEQLIAALVLAVGLASGQLLLMSAGLVCLAVGWLRPSGPGVDWTEWLKAPLLLLGALPFWLDFEAGRHPFTSLLDDPICNPLFRLPLALKVSQALLLTYGGLVAMVVLLHGRIFWLALPVLPGFVLAVSALPRLVPAWNQLPRLARFWLPWIAGGLLLALLGRLANRLERSGRPLSTGQTLRRWFEERRYPPWLAILVVAVVQALPFRGLRIETEPLLELAGLAVLALLLGAYRLRTPKGPIHSRSVAMVAGALTLTLLAEFAVSDPIRHLALGFVIIGLLSWHCFWPLRIFVTAGATVLVLFSLTPEAFPGLPVDPRFAQLRFGTALLLLAAVGWFVTLPLPKPGASGYSEDGWIPSKRFALILVGLMMLFQTASAFWPEHTMPLAPPPRLATDTILPAPAHPSDPEDAAAEPAEPVEPDPSDEPAKDTVGATPRLRLRYLDESIDVAVIQLRRNPYQVEAPERTFERLGWNVRDSARHPHPNGEAGFLRIAREGRTISILWWFELGDRAFANPLFARRILWSSWHLANRHLRLIRLETEGQLTAGQLSEFARQQNWFATPPAAPEFP